MQRRLRALAQGDGTKQDRIREGHGPRVRLLDRKRLDEPLESRQPSRERVTVPATPLDVRLRLAELHAAERGVQVRALVVAAEVGVNEVLAGPLTEIADRTHL